jgi:demethylmenaquinone methyltransferase/2-methoxy-6-polyprenyl-1,4-benzoquinol methylase
MQKGKSLPELHFMEGDAGEMPFEDGHFDSMGITFGIRNLVYENSRAGRHLSEMNRVLRTGGQLVVLESSKPANSLWRFFNDFYLRFILPYLGGLISGNRKAYSYLATSSKNYYTREEMGNILDEAGFKLLRSKSLFLGSVMLLVLEKRKQ